MRQKRRNILLGIGIAFGTCILIVANAFSHGLSDILLNKIIAVIAGHVIVTTTEKYEGTGDTKKEMQIIRDKERFKQIIQQNIQGIERVEESIGVMARGLGKSGASEFMFLVGARPDENFYQQVEVSAGNIRDLENPAFENPIVVYDDMAESLNVGLHDTLRTSFKTIYGQSQAIRFTVVALLKPSNPFMSYALMTNIEILKPLLGYQEYETASYNITLSHLTNPNVAREQANLLYQSLKPNIAGFKGVLQGNDRQKEMNVFAVAPEKEAQQTFAAQMQIASGVLDDTLKDPQALLLSQIAADELGVKVGDALTMTESSKFGDAIPPKTYRVGAIFTPNAAMQADSVFLAADAFYKTYQQYVPKNAATLDPASPVFSALLKEWRLLERSPDEEALRKKYKTLKDQGWRGTVVDVQTMYEAASGILKMERVLNAITMVAVLVLFFIILIGVVNTLRMTIRERTREIGTIRAIGMQQSDVQWSFIAEVIMLTILASLTGTVLAFIVMKLITLVIFQSTESFFTIFLVDRHLHFVVTPWNILRNLALILGIALVTSFLPSRRAAKMSVASALRHFE